MSEEGNDLPEGHSDPESGSFIELPTREDSTLRQSLESKKAFLTDMLSAVRDGDMKGILVTGRPGIGKSHLVREILGDDQGYVYCTGLLSRPMAIEKFEQHPDRLFVLDDVCGCTSDPVFQQILLHALGPNDRETGERMINYSVKGKTKRFPFTGSLLFVGNSALRGASGAVIEALESRVQTVEYSPTREELEWQMYHIAEDGLNRLPADESVRLVTFVLRECRAAERDPDIRLLLEKVLPMYERGRDGSTTCSWQEIVRRIIHCRSDAAPTPRSDDELREILRTLQQELPTSAERADEYQRRTNRSRATYYRDLNRLGVESGDAQPPTA